MAKKKKYYVVWEGSSVGIFESWEECKLATQGYSGAKYRSYPTLAEAQEAYQLGPYLASRPAKEPLDPQKGAIDRPAEHALTVDGASSGNPGWCEYRGVWLDSHEVAFASEPFWGTNNIAEFLALVHGLAQMLQSTERYPIYSDSRTAISWVRRCECRSAHRSACLARDPLRRIQRAEAWLAGQNIKALIPYIRKWDTEAWGEIPADYGRK